jgi:hypothetical protein
LFDDLWSKSHHGGCKVTPIVDCNGMSVAGHSPLGKEPRFQRARGVSRSLGKSEGNSAFQVPCRSPDFKRRARGVRGHLEFDSGKRKHLEVDAIIGSA